MDQTIEGPVIVGWREWVKLPDLGIPGIKAKIDTGAKTSCIHAFEVTREARPEGDLVHFKVHPLRKNKNVVIECTAPLIDQRVVRDSGGHAENRLVVGTRLALGPVMVEAEFTLTNRDDMLFPMLVGRRALQSANLLVDVSRSYVHGRIKTRHYQDLLEELA